MHTLGKSLRLEALGPSPAQCIVSAPRWDYSWQELALYKEPQIIRAGEPLALECTWSTVDRQSPTVFGEDTTDEMCMVFLLLGDD
jgi:hypothetical protein